MRNLLSTCNDSNLIYGSNLGAQAAMHAEKLSVNYSSENEEVKNVAARLPYGCVAVFLLAFLVEAIDLCDLARFVVASDENNAVWVSIAVSVSAHKGDCWVEKEQNKKGVDGVVLCFQAHEQCKRLQAKVSSIHVVSEKYEASLRAL